jgi:hypothetical protein
MTEDKKQEVALWSPAPFQGVDLLPVQLGARRDDLIGRDNVEAEDLILPSLKLLQGSSEEVKQGVEGARAGIFWHTGVSEGFKGPIRVLACAHTKSRALFPKADRPEHAGLDECRSKDAKEGNRYGLCAECPHSQWDDINGRPPACSESHNFTVLTPFGPAVMRFQRTSIKAARKLLTAWTMANKNLFEHPLEVSTKTRTDKVNGADSTTHVMETKWLQREAVPPHVQDAARGIYAQVMAAHAQGRFGTHDENEHTEDV